MAVRCDWVDAWRMAILMIGFLPESCCCDARDGEAIIEFEGAFRKKFTWFDVLGV